MIEVYNGMTYQGEDYSSFLEVSNLGNIRNAKSLHIYKLNNINGYLGAVISLGSRNHKKAFKVHKAVAETFIPNPNNLPVVNHKDGNKENNCVDNLEWCSISYNTQHAYDTGLKGKPNGLDHPLTLLSKEDIRYIQSVYKPSSREFGTRALGRKFKVSHSTIQYCLKMSL